MKIAIFGESPADEEAIAILIEAILGSPIERPSLPTLRARGYTQMGAELPRVMRCCSSTAMQTAWPWLSIVMEVLSILRITKFLPHR